MNEQVTAVGNLASVLLGTSGENRQRTSKGWPTRGTGNCGMYLPIAPISGSGLLPGVSAHSCISDLSWKLESFLGEGGYN